MIALQIVGYGKKRVYNVVDITASGLILPVGIRARSESAAREKAAAAGYEVKAAGDIYEIIAAANI